MAKRILYLLSLVSILPLGCAREETQHHRFVWSGSVVSYAIGWDIEFMDIDVDTSKNYYLDLFTYNSNSGVIAGGFVRISTDEQLIFQEAVSVEINYTTLQQIFRTSSSNEMKSQIFIMELQGSGEDYVYTPFFPYSSDDFPNLNSASVTNRYNIE